VQAATELQRLPGVLAVEPMRMVSARLKSRWHQQREALQGLPTTQHLYRVYDASGKAITLPQEGLVISTMLAGLLQVKPGDHLQVEVLEGRRGEYQLPIAATFETYLGSPAYLNIDALARLLQQRTTVSSVHLRVDASLTALLLQRLKQMPGISGITVKAAAIRTFDATMAQTILIFVSFFIVFSCALSIGVTYNAARIALSERGRELATLRVLGFTRLEISYLLLAEIALLTLLALPLGCVIGRVLGQFIVQSMSSELFRVPMVIDPATYAWSITVVLLATALSALVVRRRIDRLDLIAVLKTRE
jgi:putative ABC transport system permease protein